MKAKARKRRGGSKESLLSRLARGDATDRLYAAAARYVQSKRGSVLVVGGISIMKMPFDSPGKYSVLVHCVGKEPEFESGPTDASIRQDIQHKARAK